MGGKRDRRQAAFVIVQVRALEAKLVAREAIR